MVNNDSYNDFIPKLQDELRKHNIQFIDLYNEFVSSKVILYYGTDTHWNRKGVDLALKLTLDKIEKLNN